MVRKITIDPVTRVEGHGKVTIKLDENDNVIYARLHIVEFRGFERFIQGRPYWEAPVLVQRLCGICPVSHHLAASKAMDLIVGAKGDGAPTKRADLTRRLMHYAQVFQSHVLHFFHLASPDLLFGIDADYSQRNIFQVALKNPDLAKKAVLMRKFGQELIELTSGKKIHGTGSVPGGINKGIEKNQILKYLDNSHNLNCDLMIEWAEEAIEFFKNYHQKHQREIDEFAVYPSNYLSLVRSDGAMDLYNGHLKAVSSTGEIILDKIEDQNYLDHIVEGVRPWTYMKFPYLKHLGKDKGWYRVGPMARMAVVKFIPTPKAQKQFEDYQKYNNGKPHFQTMHMHWARLIEILHAAEEIKNLIQKKSLYQGKLEELGRRRDEGVGIIEAPRGTLIHHYKVNENDQITKCNLIVSTTHNNVAMNEAVGWVARNRIQGKKVIPESLLNEVEVAIRAYDPCLSCATHAIGKMPLRIELLNAFDKTLDIKIKN